jgi:hypothetical protein
MFQGICPYMKSIAKNLHISGTPDNTRVIFHEIILYLQPVIYHQIVMIQLGDIFARSHVEAFVLGIDEVMRASNVFDAGIGIPVDNIKTVIRGAIIQ